MSLQAIASYDLWVWSAYFGILGSNNNINVLEASPVVEDYISATIPIASLWANDKHYPHRYYLGLHFRCRTSRPCDPIDENKWYLKKVQESLRNDIERCFGVLRQRWHYVKKDEWRAICQHFIPWNVQQQTKATMEERVQNAYEMRSSEINNSLMADLVQHAWSVRPIRDEGENVLRGDDDERDKESEDEFEGDEESEDEFEGQDEDALFDVGF
ncbi:uncharacterized protein LOC143535141 [Bidens hawaiensis]|uniref:uncharacterized protein LOC143535141 n=1 Tax=Bidens hawaiensis TaxID=980011 RepID=UPI004049996B